MYHKFVPNLPEKKINSFIRANIAFGIKDKINLKEKHLESVKR